MKMKVMKMEVGERIKELREQQGLTQKKLGELCGIAEPNIRKYENSKQNPKLETVEKIANALNVSVLVLLGFSLSDIPTKELLAEIERRCK